ncbi:c-type cytochrome [Bergeyella sp. RCAD1439]|uniref:c-type cytochrome n=1 Tax=Bergeyella anatis TaxID=3113737 RepID=UPI002E17C1AE|nr:cytochrome c [Bergeyella sp. RCAD1439]
MLKMKKNILKITAILGFAGLVLTSCGKGNPPLVYFPDMYFPVAYDPLQKAEDPYSKHDNEVPAFVKQNGATALTPVPGTVPQNRDGIFAEGLLPANMDEYNAGYEASKAVTVSPLNPANAEKDLARGKVLYEKTCSACHGTAGDGQGSIVQTGAYVGVPKYADRAITLGTVHYVIENGRNAMGSYAGQLTPGDRWRVAMYVMNEFKGGPAAPAAGTTAAVTDSTATK